MQSVCVIAERCRSDDTMVIYEKAIADPKVQELIRVREKAEMDYKDAMARKYDEGRAEERAKAEAEKYAGKIEMARKLLNAGVDIGIISTSTGLSTEELNKIL